MQRVDPAPVIQATARQARVTRRFPWALLPGEGGAEPPLAVADDGGFRYLRPVRRSARCGPFRRALHLTLEVLSPVDVTLAPAREFQFSCEEAGLADFVQDNGLREVWRREAGYIGFMERSGLRAYDFRTPTGWEAMFLPNGEQSWEWRLGFDLEVGEGRSALFLPAVEQPDLQVMLGVLDHSDLSRMGASTGVSIAVRPLRRLDIRRGEPIARLLVVEGLVRVRSEAGA